MPCELSRSPHSGQHSSSHIKVSRSASGLRLLGRRPTVIGSPPGEMLLLCTMIDCCVNYTLRGADRLETMKLPAMANLWCMLNTAFWVETDVAKRAFLYLDSVLLSGEWE